MQQHHRFKLVPLILATALLGSMTSASADGPSGSASEAETLGCQSDGYKEISTWPLRRNGKSRPGIGHVQILYRPSPSDSDDVRVCAITKHGGRTLGKKRYTAIEIGSEDQGENGTQDLKFWDRDPYATERSDGRAITPGEDRCAIIHGVIKSGGKKFQVWVDQAQILDHKICN